jgi:hypothetical protein
MENEKFLDVENEDFYSEFILRDLENATIHFGNLLIENLEPKRKFYFSWKFPFLHKTYVMGTVIDPEVWIDIDIEERFILSYKNLIMGPVAEYVNKNPIATRGWFKSKARVDKDLIKELAGILEFGTMTFSIAKKIVPEIIKTGQRPLDVVKSMGVEENGNVAEIEAMGIEAMEKFPGKVKEYKAGKKGLLSMFVGEVLRNNKDKKPNPSIVNEVMKGLLEK